MKSFMLAFFLVVGVMIAPVANACDTVNPTHFDDPLVEGFDDPLLEG